MNTFGFRVAFIVVSDAFMDIPSEIDWLDEELVRKYIIDHWDCVELPNLKDAEVLPGTLRFADNTNISLLIRSDANLASDEFYS